MSTADRSGMEEFLGQAGLAQSRSSNRSADAQEHIGVEISGARVVVGWIDLAWPHPATPAAVLRDEVELPVGSDPAAAVSMLESSIEVARRARRRQLAACASCGGSSVPGHMHHDTMCQGCAQRELGVVY
jgi:hypothetical protein